MIGRICQHFNVVQGLTAVLDVSDMQDTGRLRANNSVPGGADSVAMPP
jgi:hypothetical protein